MDRYDYYVAVKEDVLSYIRENISLEDYSSLDELESALNDDLWTEDSVTGNGSGSYTFSNWQAEEYLCHNLDLVREMASEFGEDVGKLLAQGAETVDVCVRCYVLPFAIADAMAEIWEEFEACHDPVLALEE